MENAHSSHISLYKEGRLVIDNERVVVTSASVLGTLKEELLGQLGQERTKGFFIRYGWNIGTNDAKKIKDDMQLSLREKILKGPTMHMVKGYTSVEDVVLEVDEADTNRFFISGTWRKSVESKEHVRRLGIANEPICYSLAGYVSGYLSELIGEPVIVKECTCEAMGHEKCTWMGKTIHKWGDDILQELPFYNQSFLHDELQNAYEQVLYERDELAKVIAIHKRLMEEVTTGKNLSSIARVIAQSLKVTVFIVDHTFQLLTSYPAIRSVKDQESLRLVSDKWKKSKEAFEETITFEVCQKTIISAPIRIRKQVVGYCLCEFLHAPLRQTSELIVERSASACSVYLLNEAIVKETEQRMRGRFLEELINDTLTEEEINKRAYFIGISMQTPFHIITLQVEEKKKEPSFVYFDDWIEQIWHFFEQQDIHALIGQMGSLLVIYIQEDAMLEKFSSLSTFLTQLFQYCQTYQPKATIRIGASSKGESVTSINDRVSEASFALRMISGQNSIQMFDCLGSFAVLLKTYGHNESAVKGACRQLLHHLLIYDHSKNFEYTKTLYTFILNGGNLEQTARAFAISISGLRYRLQKIEKLLNMDLKTPTNLYHLYFAIQTLIAFGDLQMEA